MTDDPMHPRTEPVSFQQAPRCGARTRSGKSCQSPAVRGKARCRMHGGAFGSGGPRGNRNGNFKHGLYTQETQSVRQATRAKIREIKALIQTAKPRAR